MDLVCAIWSPPAYRFFSGVASIMLGLIALPTVNLGGFFIGTLLALIGGALSAAWSHGRAGRRRRAASAARRSPRRHRSEEFENESTEAPTSDLPEVEETGAHQQPGGLSTCAPRRRPGARSRPSRSRSPVAAVAGTLALATRPTRRAPRPRCRSPPRSAAPQPRRPTAARPPPRRPPQRARRPTPAALRRRRRAPRSRPAPRRPRPRPPRPAARPGTNVTSSPSASPSATSSSASAAASGAG